MDPGLDGARSSAVTHDWLGTVVAAVALQLLSGSEYPNMFEEFLEPEEYIGHGHLFTIDQIFNSKDELVDWTKQIAMNIFDHQSVSESTNSLR